MVFRISGDRFGDEEDEAREFAQQRQLLVGRDDVTNGFLVLGFLVGTGRMAITSRRSVFGVIEPSSILGSRVSSESLVSS